ncbi:MAG TPA: hypothetical protein VLX12_06365, partial [Syntrophorhabdales bacterium]|nr:hypothetical protein [Syntrophorhabdales bacterium]
MLETGLEKGQEPFQPPSLFMNSARNLHCITHNGMGFVGMNQDGLQWQQAQGFARRQEEMMHIEHRYMEMPMRKRSLV